MAARRAIAALAAGCAALALAGGGEGALLYYHAAGSGGDRVFYEIDTATGASTLHMTLSGVNSGGLAQGDATNLLFAPREAPDELLAIDLASGSFRTIGPTAVLLKELGWDPGRRVLYGTDYPNLYNIDAASGATTLIGSFGGPTQMWALDFDPLTDTLFGVDQGTSLLYRIDTATGLATAIGPTGVTRVSDIYAETSDGQLYAIVQEDNSLRVLDKTTGQAGPSLGTLRVSFAVGLAAPPKLSCLAPSLAAIRLLLGAKTAPDRARFSWDETPGAVEYHLNSVADKRDLASANRAPRGIGAPECDGRPGSPVCDDSGAATPLRLYQAVAACGPGGDLEGPLGP